PTGSHVCPPSFERWMTCPNQPLHCDAYTRFGSTGDPLTWKISQPAKWGPLTSHFSRLPSEVRMKAPLRVPTSTRTLLILSFLFGNLLAKLDSFKQSSNGECRNRHYFYHGSH